MINATRLHEICLDSLFNEEELKEGVEYCPGYGVLHNFGFKPEKIEEYAEEVKDILSNLEEGFFTPHGESFLKLPFDKMGQQWGEHANAEELVLIGSATGYVDFSIPRIIWNLMPGSVPFITVSKERKNIEKQKITKEFLEKRGECDG